MGGFLLSIACSADYKDRLFGIASRSLSGVERRDDRTPLEFLDGEYDVRRFGRLGLIGTVLSLSKMAWITCRKYSTSRPAPVDLSSRSHRPPRRTRHRRRHGLPSDRGLLCPCAALTYSSHRAGILDGHVRRRTCINSFRPVLQRDLVNLQLARLALWSLPVGFAVLLAGFVTSFLYGWNSLWAACWSLASAFCTYNLITTWVKSGLPGNAASDHLLIGIVFLLLGHGRRSCDGDQLSAELRRFYRSDHCIWWPIPISPSSGS